MNFSEAIEHCKTKELYQLSTLPHITQSDFESLLMWCYEKEFRPIYIFFRPSMSENFIEWVMKKQHLQEECQRKYGDSLQIRIKYTNDFDKNLKCPVLFSFDAELNEPVAFFESY